MPTILCEIDPCDGSDPNGSLKKSYIYTPGGQVLAQYDCNGFDEEANSIIVNGKYFYVHDRLGNVRLVVNEDGDVNNSYTYNPFGEEFATECTETVYNPFKFTGQWYDSEIGQYYLRARMYDPAFMRFTDRDPVRGKFNRPMTLHPYLYCTNDPINRTDLTGEYGEGLVGQLVINAIRGAFMGALTGGMTRGLVTQSLSGAVEGALYGAIGGGISGGLASLSAAGYMFAAIESSPALQGMIAGGSAGIAEGVVKREDLRAIFTRAIVGSVGGLAGGYLGNVEPQAISGIPGGIAGGQMASNYYEFFFRFFGGYPSSN